jgi:hypothetical protein
MIPILSTLFKVLQVRFVCLVNSNTFQAVLLTGYHRIWSFQRQNRILHGLFGSCSTF